MKYYYLLGFNNDAQAWENLHGSYSRKECQEEKVFSDWSYEYSKLRIVATQDSTPINSILSTQ